MEHRSRRAVTKAPHFTFRLRWDINKKLSRHPFHESSNCASGTASGPSSGVWASAGKLKDAFNGLLIGSIDPDDDGAAFSFENTSQCRGMAVIGLWYMLREAELAGAKAGDIRLDGREVTLTIQLHKTDHTGRFTQRTLTCSCRVRTHTMCVWRRAERHPLRRISSTS